MGRGYNRHFTRKRGPLYIQQQNKRLRRINGAHISTFIQIRSYI